MTLLGMSGVGKTTLGCLLPRETWFHYSGDYRIGTRYLDETILDVVKTMAMQHPELKKLLQADCIYIRNNITIQNLEPLSLFLGKIGNPDLGGLGIAEFKRRQRLYLKAEADAMADVDSFIEKGQKIYGYPHFLNDAGGSIYSLSEAQWQRLADKTLILYLEASEEMEQTLIERARKTPKPLNYDEPFLDEKLSEYMAENCLKDAGEIVPDEFVQWMFPKLMEYRKPLYESIANQHGYRLDARKIFDLRDEKDLIDLICDAIGD